MLQITDFDSVFMFILIALVTHRITRFILRDCMPIIAIPRERFLRWTDPTIEDVANGAKPRGALMRSLGYLFQCEWCMSIWTSAVVIGVLWGTHFLDTDWRLLTALWLANASVTALIMDRVETEYDGCE